MFRRQLGMTLIELMIVVVIITILAAIAVPAYSKYAMRARRSDAINAIQFAAAAEEKYYFAHNAYTDNATLGISASTEGYYTIAITNSDAQHYLITVAPVTTGPQAADTDCMQYTLDNTGLKTPGNPGNPDIHACWHH